MSKAAETVITLSLSAGERAGVRAGVNTHCRIYFDHPLNHFLTVDYGVAG